MNYHELLVNGATIEVKPHMENMNGFASSVFWYDKGKLHTKNAAMGAFPRSNDEYPALDFNSHIDQICIDAISGSCEGGVKP